MEFTYEEIERIKEIERIEKIERLEANRQNFTDRWLRNHNKIEENTEGYVYLIKCADKYKIGYTKDIDRRFKELDTRPFPCELIAYVDSPIAFPVEQKIHELLKEKRVVGEWYSFEFESTAEQFEDFVYQVEIQMLKWG